MRRWPRWARVEGDRLRFRRAQAGLLDALLASQPEVSVDAQFAKARDELRQFTGVRAAKAPRAFRGELRPYQEAGLGWLSFLRRFGFGGCLADDMGLGKTIQVLAMLAGRPRRKRAPFDRGGAEVAGLELGAGGGALRTEAARPRPRRPRARRERDRAATQPRRRRPPGHDLRRAAQGRRLPARDRGGLRHPRRGAGDQERRLRIGEGGAAAAAETIVSRCPARRSKTIWASCGR